MVNQRTSWPWITNLWANDPATKGKEAGTEYLYGLWALPLLQAIRAKVIGETGTSKHSYFYPLLCLGSNNTDINCHHNND